MCDVTDVVSKQHDLAVVQFIKAMGINMQYVQPMHKFSLDRVFVGHQPEPPTVAARPRQQTPVTGDLALKELPTT